MTNILLATEDKSRFSEMIETFQSYGCRVNTVDSGSSALAEIEGKSCDLLISDENLPDMTGKTLMENRFRKSSYGLRCGEFSFRRRLS